MTDELAQVMRGLPPLQRQMVELRLQGTSVDEIAAVTQRNERTVRRVFKHVETELRQRCSRLAGG